jgi:hypothetical protein
MERLQETRDALLEQLEVLDVRRERAPPRHRREAGHIRGDELAA